MEQYGCRLQQLLLLLLHVFALGAHGIRFDLASGQSKCFAEELQLKALVLAKYHVVSQNAPKISVKVTDPHGNTMHSADSVDSGDFAFTATDSGNYLACLWMPGATTGVTITVDLDWKTGVAAKDWADIAKREKIDGIELELRKLEEEVDAIHEEMLYLRSREEEMRSVNEITNFRMAWFSVTSLFICLLVAGLQLWYLKTFFERKKLL